METTRITDLIEITQANVIQIRDVMVFANDEGTMAIRELDRHSIDGECSNEHPIAHAIRDALPPVLPHEHEPNTTLLSPDFIRVMVRSGFVRVDDHLYIIGDKTENQRMAAVPVLTPGGAPSMTIRS